MKRLTSAQLFVPPKIARKTKARLERAKLIVVAARERAAEMAQRYAAQPSTKRPATVLQRRRSYRPAAVGGPAWVGRSGGIARGRLKG
jgi:hypothetical protein